MNPEIDKEQFKVEIYPSDTLEVRDYFYLVVTYQNRVVLKFEAPKKSCLEYADAAILDYIHMLYRKTV